MTRYRDIGVQMDSRQDHGIYLVHVRMPTTCSVQEDVNALTVLLTNHQVLDMEVLVHPVLRMGKVPSRLYVLQRYWVLGDPVLGGLIALSVNNIGRSLQYHPRGDSPPDGEGSKGMTVCGYQMCYFASFVSFEKIQIYGYPQMGYLRRSLNERNIEIWGYYGQPLYHGILPCPRQNAYIMMYARRCQCTNVSAH